MKNKIVFMILVGIILVTYVSATTIIRDNSASLGGNTTIQGTLINITTPDSSLKLYTQNHVNFGDTNGESIELWGLVPTAKPYIGWYGWDEATSRVRAIGWLGCHYNLTNGDIHSHCSIETLDNSTGTPSINTHFEISYNASQTRAGIKFPQSDVEFIGNQRLFFGDSQNAYIMQNASTGDLELKANADVILWSSQLDINNKAIVNVDDIFSNSTNSIDLKSGTTTRIMPNSQTTRILTFSDGGDGINVSIGGGTILRIMANELLTLQANTTTSTCNSASAGAIYYDGSTLKHYGCNSTTWNALY